MIRFNLNGAWVEASDVAPTTTLLRWLRDTRGLSGTKEGCAEGDCGACTVAVVEQGAKGPEYRAVNSCLLLLPMVHGKHVVTVDGLKREQLHPAQQALAEALGSQCGYCTPGVVMTMFEATYRGDLDAPWKLDDQLCGNLCRCTGYRPIREAAQQVAGTCPADAFSKALPGSAPADTSLQVTHGGQRFTTPATFDALWDELDAHPDARFVVGGTDLSLEITKRFQAPPKLVSLEALAPLRALTEVGGGLHLGATATIAELEAFTAARSPAIHRMVRYFGARQIKHRGTLGGNLCTASPIGDLAPVFLSLGASAVLRSRAGERRVPLHEFFVAYRKTALAPKEVLAAIEVPRTSATARSVAYKVSKRRELDISTVSAGLFVDTDAANVVTVARFAFGGVAATPKRANAAERAVMGKPWTREAALAASKLLSEDLTPLTDHRGSANYRALVARNLLVGFYDETLTVQQPALQPGHAATVQPGGAS
jgi:xanthine dehydrogenase small subunit